MACQTGNGSSVAFTGYTEFNTALILLSIDMGEETRETLRYRPLVGSREIAKPGDMATPREITFEGLMDIADVPTNGPDLVQWITDTMTISLPTAGVTFVDTGHFEAITGPTLENDVLMPVTVKFVTSNEGAGRGWTAAT